MKSASIAMLFTTSCGHFVWLSWYLYPMLILGSEVDGSSTAQGSRGDQASSEINCGATAIGRDISLLCFDHWLVCISWCDERVLARKILSRGETCRSLPSVNRYQSPIALSLWSGASSCRGVQPKKVPKWRRSQPLCQTAARIRCEQHSLRGTGTARN